MHIQYKYVSIELGLYSLNEQQRTVYMFIDETDETDKFESSLPFQTPTQCT